VRSVGIEENGLPQGGEGTVIVTLVAQSPSLDDVALYQQRVSCRGSFGERRGLGVVTKVEFFACPKQVVNR